jgi:4-aminobutyrate aminotransferase-like enzyme
LPAERDFGKDLKNEIIEMQRQYVTPCVEAWHDILFVKGYGSKLYDSEGKEYIDCFGGVAVVNIGHCHPKVIEAVDKQLRELTHLSTLYYTEAMPRLAKHLSEIAPMDRKKAKKSFFCNSGTEANEHAVTLAKKATGKNEILSLQCGFYGRAGTTAGLTGLGAWRAGLGPFTPGIYHAPSYYCYRCPMGYKNGPPDCNWACANYIQHILKTETTKNVAAFIVEPILGVGGCVPAPKDYFKIVREILLSENILLIVDEVQSGNGRTGRLFGVEHYEVEPDIVTVAKGLGGGLLPIGAVISKSEIADKHVGPDFSTFGGNPLSCLAALANLKVIQEENLAENAARIGNYMIKRLKEIEHDSKIVDGVEGIGLMIGMEIVVDKEKKSPATNDTLMRIMNDMAAEGVLVGRGGLYYNRIRMEPPLCITKGEANRVLNVFEEVVKRNQN